MNLRPTTVPTTQGLQLTRQTRVSASEFETPVHSPYGEQVSLGDREAMSWVNSDQGRVFSAQRLEQRLDREGPQLAEERTDPFVGPGGLQFATERREQGRAVDEASGDQVTWSRFSSGYGTPEPRFHTEVRHSPNGLVTILEYQDRPLKVD